MTLNVHKFAAIKGRQSGDDYFTVVCEMALIPKLFLFYSALDFLAESLHLMKFEQWT